MYEKLKDLNTFQLLEVLDNNIKNENEIGKTKDLDLEYIYHALELTSRMLEDNDYILLMISKIKDNLK